MQRAYNVRVEPGRLENLLAAAVLAVAERVRAAAEDAVGIGAGGPAALVSISSFLDGQTIGSLAATTGLSHAAAVRLVDRLQERGLIRRVRGQDDLREVRLEATRSGRAAARRVLAERRAAMAGLLDTLSAAEREALTRLLERLLEDMPADRAGARRICRLCDIDVCGHPERCPVSQGVLQICRLAPPSG